MKTYIFNWDFGNTSMHKIVFANSEKEAREIVSYNSNCQVLSNNASKKLTVTEIIPTTNPSILDIEIGGCNCGW